MSEPHEYTADQCRALMFTQMALSLRYWRDLPVQKLMAHQSDGRPELDHRMEGLLFSILTMFDGGCMGIPGLDIVPAPHADDKAFLQAEGENWWPEKIVINNCQMHEVFPWDLCLRHPKR